MHKISLAWSLMHKIVAQVQQVTYQHMVVNKCLLWLDLLFMHVIITFNQILNFEYKRIQQICLHMVNAFNFHFV